MSSLPTVYALVDGLLGEKVANWLRHREDIKLLASISERERLSEIRERQPDLIVSAGYTHIVPEEIINVPEKGTVNLHYSFLPYCRGANTNVWSIIEDHPAGVSIHYMTEEVDSGPIIDRKEVEVRPDDNGRDLYERLIEEQFDLFVANWESILSGETSPQPNETERGTYHSTSEFESLCQLDLDEEMKLGETIDLLRALTFPPYDNAYFTKDGKKYYVEIDITPEDETQNGET